MKTPVPVSFLFSSALFAAARLNNLALLDLLLNANASSPEYINFQDTETGQTPLMLASYNGHLDIVNKLIGSNADVNLLDAKNQTALALAVMIRFGDYGFPSMAEFENKYTIAKHLLEAGASPDVVIGDVEGVEKLSLLMRSFDYFKLGR